MRTAALAWDVVVVGGGPSGSITAASLAEAGHHVALLEADTRGRRRLAEMLPPQVVRQLSAAGADDAPTAGAAMRCRGVVSKWGEQEAQMLDYELLGCGHGWIVDRPGLDQLLRRRAAQAGVDVHLGWRCVRVSPRRAACDVTIATSDSAVRAVARAVVNAAGRSGGWEARGRAYYDRQLAFAATCQSGANLRDCVWVEGFRRGWCYALPVPGGGAQVVWVTNVRPSSLDDAARSALLRTAFESTEMIRSAFAAHVIFDSVFTYDARLSTAVGDVVAPVFRVGDALATSDPLSGRGWAQALRSAADVAEMVHDYLCTRRMRRFATYQREAVAGIRSHIARRTAYHTI